MTLPEKVDVSPDDIETFLCIQYGEKITFLKAESKWGFQIFYFWKSYVEQ